MKLFVKLGFLITFIMIVLGVLSLTTKNQTGELAAVIDRFNPFVPKNELYVLSKEPDSVNSYGTAYYVQTGIDKNGKTRKIGFNAIQKMSTGIYVRIKNKGAYVEEIEKVEKAQLPNAIVEKVATLK